MKASLYCTLAFAVFLSPSLPKTVFSLDSAEKSAAAKSESTSLDPGWPREVDRNGVRFVYYQPQVDEWKDFRELRARVAFTLSPKGGKPAVGIEELKGDTTTDLEKRTVLINNIEITAVRFPSLFEDEAAKMETVLKSNFPGKPLTVSLDRLIASVQSGQENVKPVPVKTDPPQIFVTTQPAILLSVEGKPVLAPIKGTKLQFVLNTGWDLFFEPSESQYYLLAGKSWLTAKSLDGPWRAAEKLPSDFSKLSAANGWEHVQKAAATKMTKTSKVPKVLFANQPAELIAFAGEPTYKDIQGTKLSYATNTDSWVFKDSTDGQFYYLITGRWFRASNLEGPWSYAGNDLPEDFSKIPPGSEVSEVLASVPGTDESKDAVLLAQVPTVAVVKRAEAESKAKVEYTGEPEFAPIPGTDLSYATNADADVIRLADQYYLCLNAVWFVSSTPKGPWKIVTDVPEPIYSIPPSSPVYHVTYAKVEKSNQNEVVCSYTSGYSGAYIAGVATGAALVWGTGYYYPPYVYWGPVPVYRPYYATYGVSAVYYPYTGTYAVGGYAYGPYSAAGSAAWYNPSTGAYGRAYTQQYPYGGRTSAWGYNPSTNTSWTTQQGHGYYAQWGTSTITQGGQTIQAGHVVTNYGSTGVVKGQDNLYAAHDGNVYKRDDNGDWSKWNDGQWQPVNPPNKSSGTNQAGQSNLSSQNQGTNRRNAAGSATPGQPSNRRGGGANAAATPGTARARPSPGNTRDQTERPSDRTRQSSDELTNSLNREASGRQRGAQNESAHQRYQQRRASGSIQNAERSFRGGSGRMHRGE
jgi:hypothetical protein